MTRPTLTEEDWAIMYLSWLSNLPLTDSLPRWAGLRKRAGQDGHCGSCVKQPGSCSLCTVEECLKGGKDMAAAWNVEAARERPEVEE
jgi:hypothetical protein